ncbi:hypothetical protein ACFE04_021565 [Oxalis oulophora]
MIGETERWYPCGSNLVSVELRELMVFHPPEMMRLLTNAGLKYLRVETSHLGFNVESFKKLVDSQLHTIWFDRVSSISGPPMSMLDSRLEANRTVKNLYVITFAPCPKSTLMLFPKYFRGLVHLSINCVTDSILQIIFQFQENLRSLKLGQCSNCSIHGFRVSTIAGSKYAISELRSKCHYGAKYAMCRPDERGGLLGHIVPGPDLKRGPGKLRYAQIPTVLFENLTELRALRLKNVAIPSHETLSSLFSSLRNLNYLRYDVDSSKDAISFALSE